MQSFIGLKKKKVLSWTTSTRCLTSRLSCRPFQEVGPNPSRDVDRLRRWRAGPRNGSRTGPGTAGPGTGAPVNSAPLDHGTTPVLRRSDEDPRKRRWRAALMFGLYRLVHVVTVGGQNGRSHFSLWCLLSGLSSKRKNRQLDWLA